MKKATTPVVSQVWKFDQPDTFTYPENDPAFKDFFEGKENFGISFSGGGSRSATCTIGQLRGLHQIGVLSSAKYIASNSGGTWGSLPYIYFKGDLTRFFGTYYAPEELTADRLTNIDQDTFLYQMTKAPILLKAFFNQNVEQLGDESYSRAVADIFLRSLDIGYIGKWFTLNATSFENIKSNNPGIKQEDFEEVAKGRPFHIANGTLHNWKKNKKGLKASRKGKNRLYPLEMTPLYTGIKVYHPGRGDKNMGIGGGYIEPFAFDTVFKKLKQKNGQPLVKVDPSGKKKVPQERKFTLADVVGISGSAPSSGDISVEREDPSKLKRQFIKWGQSKDSKLLNKLMKIYQNAPYITNALPEARHFPLRNMDHPDYQTIEYNVGDGGPVDDIAVMPLLARGVPKILCFCNVQSKIISRKFRFKKYKLDKDVLRLFGLERKKPFRKKIQKIKGGGFQQVFKTEDFDALSNAFEKAMKKGQPLIYEGTHEVLPNEHFGIQGGYTVKILWFYNERCKNYEEKIASSVLDDLGVRIGKRNNLLKNFPNFKTFLENPPRAIEMKAVQASLLSNYQTWIILQHQEKIRAFLKS